MQALWGGKCRSFWANTGAYDTVASYIQMNFEGLKDDVIRMLSGGRCKVDPTGFLNDMSVIRDKNDVFTVLIHLGYLVYNWDADECYIPNKEVEGAKAVAHGVDAAHDVNTTILSYNDENSLAYVLGLAFYYAKNDYIFHRELPTGKGFADLVLMPRNKSDRPAILLELKKDQSVQTAIDQIHRKVYHGKVADYTGRVILVGINYDSKSKSHECRIEFYSV